MWSIHLEKHPSEQRFLGHLGHNFTNLAICFPSQLYAWTRFVSHPFFSFHLARRFLEFWETYLTCDYFTIWSEFDTKLTNTICFLFVLSSWLHMIMYNSASYQFIASMSFFIYHWLFIVWFSAFKVSDVIQNEGKRFVFILRKYTKLIFITIKPTNRVFKYARCNGGNGNIIWDHRSLFFFKKIIIWILQILNA